MLGTQNMSAGSRLLIASAEDNDLDTLNGISETRKLYKNFNSELYFGHDEAVGNFKCLWSYLPFYPEIVKAIYPVFLTVGIILFVIGFIKFYDCPVEPELPFILIIEGAVIFVKIILRTSIYCFGSDQKNQKNIDSSSCNNFQNSLHGLITLFLVFWSITGCILVYGMYGKVQLERPDLPEYCDITLYMTAFSIATLLCAVVTIVIMGQLCLLILWVYKRKCSCSE
ncbi:hypothetical protein CHS0354_007011 [Potamilus streckersoni]|uniref:Uncharacterized protein n=1 Tax=Potamilus streckersoni TaxID=2493646 RepID=A0AAE0VK90_9BIVA|nr:hypothetical protein CHS0354_007011 [Potamilus streckersoni]